MLEVTTIGSYSHIGSYMCLVHEVRHSLVDMVLWQHFPHGLQDAFNSSVVLGFSWSLWYTFPVWRAMQMRFSSGFKSGEFGDHFLEPETVHLQPFLHEA